VVGIITRKDLTIESLTERALEVQLQRTKGLGISTDGFGAAHNDVAFPMPPPPHDSSGGAVRHGGSDGLSPLLAEVDPLSAPMAVKNYGGL
jgi:hypothetical protein